MTTHEPIDLKAIRAVLRQIKKAVEIAKPDLRNRGGVTNATRRALCDIQFEFSKLVSPVDPENRHGTEIIDGDTGRIYAAGLPEALTATILKLQIAIPAAANGKLLEWDAAIETIDAFLNTKAGEPTPRITIEEANVQARAALKKKPPKGKDRWTERTLAKAIGVKAINRLPAWQAYYEPYRKPKPGGRIKAVALTDKLLATTGQNDPVLQKLIKEQCEEAKADERGLSRRKQ